MSQNAARVVFPGFKFGIDDPALAETLVDLGVGGFCLYGGSIPEVAEMTARLQARARRPLLFSADYEDGVASQTPGGTPFPSNMGLGAAGDPALARKKGELTAVESAALGVRWVFAPVVDLATEPDSLIVNVRAFGDEPGPVARLARAYIEGLKSQGVLSCLKHYPGHGHTSKDSHLELPTVKVSEDVLAKRELAPYRELAEAAVAVMTAHLMVPAMDKKLPISLSPTAVSKTLRREFGFEGLVSTDALSMEAIAGKWGIWKPPNWRWPGARRDPSAPGAQGISVRVAEESCLRSGPGRRSKNRRGAVDRVMKAAGSVGTPAPELVGCLRHMEAAQALAEKCLAWGGAPAGPLPKAVSYLEADSEDPADWAGGPFLEELRALGIAAEPWPQAGSAKPLIVGCFVRPRAYSGRIDYEAEVVARLRKALAGAPGGAVVSFGNPFVLKSFPKSPGLCSFAGDALAQKAAARALAGRIPVTGRMPVRWT